MSFRIMRARNERQAPGAGNPVEDRLMDTLEELEEFEDFKKALLPELRRLIKSKAPTEEILSAARAAAVARLASLAVMEEDSKTALGAIKELMDRLHGKSTEKKEITHAMAKLKDEELDALVLTSLSDEEGNSEAD